MLTRIAFLSLTLAASAAQAATSPQRVGFQGKLLDTSNNPRNGSFNITFGVFPGAGGGVAAWTETQNGVAVTNGLLSVELGAVTALASSLFLNASAYLEVTVEGEPPMAPRQLLLMSPSAFRALYAEDLAAGDTEYIQARTTLQSGAVFHVSSATVAGPFMATGTSSFTATGAQTFSVVTSSGLRVQAGTLRVESGANVDVQNTVYATTVSAVTGLVAPQAAVSNAEGSVSWDAANDRLRVGTGAGSKTMDDLNSSNSLSNKVIASTNSNVVDATRIHTRTISAGAPSDGMTLEWDNAGSQWYPVHSSTITAVYVSFAPTAATTLAVDTVFLIPVAIAGTLSLNQIRFRVSNAVVGSTGDVGLYNASGQLVASGGANSADYTTTGAKVIGVQGAPKLLQPGQYYFAVSCTGGAAKLRGVDLATAGVLKGLGTEALSAGAGSTLPASVNLGSLTDGTLVPFMSANE